MSDTHDNADEAPSAAPEARPRGPGPIITLLICLVILAAGGGALFAVFVTEPTAERVAATRETAMLVDTAAAEAGTFRPTVVATGTVRPAREIVLRPRVEGRVISHSEGFVPGGTVAKGETLVRLDAADYRNALRQRRNDLDQARAELRIEQGRRTLAETEFELLDQQVSAEKKALVLREPQLDAARSRVASARTAVEQAELRLARARIEAPFDATVLTREVNVGSQVAAGDALARMVATDTYWVEASVPVAKLRWLAFPDAPDDGGGAPVEIRNRGAWPDDAHRTGRLIQRVGTLDEATRMARVLIAVDDPLARAPGNATRPVLMLGAYVRVRMQGRPVEDVVRLDRDHVRSDETAWVMRDGKLDIRELDIAVRDSEYAYVRSGLQAGDRVVTSELATIREGAPLRLDGDGGGDGGSGDS